ncbi:hypothetical protein EDB86DRAFT_3246109 [Lactarius hatsudake]|nr:hypothetical protein EDB86DRAFT_3246109 [Lactarius hatsudake]
MTTNIWCLLIDEDHEPDFGEPFPVSIRHDDTIHELKVKIQMMWGRHKLSHIPPNDLEIWKCKSLELSARDSFDLTKNQLVDLKPFDDEDSDVTANIQHLGVAQRMTEFSNRRDDEIWLVVVPQNDADLAVFVWDTQFLAEALLYVFVDSVQFATMYPILLFTNPVFPSSRLDRPHTLDYSSVYERYTGRLSYTRHRCPILFSRSFAPKIHVPSEVVTFFVVPDIFHGRMERATPEDITTSLSFVVWCLAIDNHHNPIFGEPFPVTIKIMETEHSPHLRRVVVTNSLQIWKCKNLKLSAKDSFSQTRKQVGNLRFSDEEDSHVQHLGAAQRIMDLQLEDSEILLALEPRQSRAQLHVSFLSAHLARPGSGHRMASLDYCAVPSVIVCFFWGEFDSSYIAASGSATTVLIPSSPSVESELTGRELPDYDIK